MERGLLGSHMLTVTTVSCLSIAVQRLEQGPLLFGESVQLPVCLDELKLLLVEKSSGNGLLPFPPDLSVVGEEFIKDFNRFFRLKNKEDEDHHSCARAQVILGQHRFMEYVVQQDVPLDLLFVQGR